jgi:hypothetical protein
LKDLAQIIHSKRLAVWVLILLAAWGWNVPKASATHLLGGAIYYTHIGNQTGVSNQYRIFLVLNREVSGASVGGSATVEVRSTACNVTSNVYVTLSAVEAPDSTAFDCVPGSSVAFDPRINVFTGVVILPNNCPDVIMRFYSCCRPPGVTGLVSSNTQGFYLEAELNTTLVGGVPNSSPEIAGSGVLFHREGDPLNAPMQAIDPDGDSVHYELIPLRQDSPLGDVVDYALGYTYLQPLIALAPNQVTLNPTTGMLSVVPSQVQSNMLAIKATDYRWDSGSGQWVKMGSSMREVFAKVVATGQPNPKPFKLAEGNGWVANAQGQVVRAMSCGDTAFEVVTVNPVVRAAINATDFRLQSASGSMVPLKRVTGTGTTGQTDSIWLVTQAPLYSGTYYLTNGLFDGSPLVRYCDLNTDTLGVLTVSACAPPAAIQCPGVASCPTSIASNGPHTYYSSWSDTLGAVPPHQSLWSVANGWIDGASDRDTATVYYNDTSGLLVLETRFSLCTEYDTLRVGQYLGVTSASPKVFEVRPNPAHDAAWVVGMSPGTVVRIHNTLGQKVFEHRFHGDGSLEIPMVHWPKGSYWVSATGPEGTVYQTLIKL